MKPRTEYFSATRFKAIHSCPMKFYLQYCAPYPVNMPQSWGAANGTLLHEVLEEYARGERKDWRNNLLEKFRKMINDPAVLDYVFRFAKGQKLSVANEIKSGKRSCGTCPYGTKMADGATVFCNAVGKKTDEFLGTPKKMLDDTFELAEVIFDNDFNPIDDAKVIGVEQEFKIVFPNGVPVWGFMDLVSEINEDTIEIRDYKSAKRVPTDQEILDNKLYHDIQMQIYYVAAKYMCDNDIPPFSKKYKNIFVTIHFLRKSPITIFYNDLDYDKILYIMYKERDKILNLEKPLPLGMTGKDKFWICNYCNIDACQQACIEIHGKTREELANE